MASTMLDFPHPFGPTMALIPGGKASCARTGKDLNPRKSSLLSRIAEQGGTSCVNSHDCIMGALGSRVFKMELESLLTIPSVDVRSAGKL